MVSDEELARQPTRLGEASEDDFDDFGSEEEDFPLVKVQKRGFDVQDADADDEKRQPPPAGPPREFRTEEEDGDITKVRSRVTKLKKLTPEQLAKEQKRIKKTGVCYLSSIPPYMKPAKLRSVLSRFGDIDRLFLKPEDTAIHKKRVKYGGNKKKNYTEGWVEFLNKKDAKLCVATLNGNKIGGKKTSFYYDDIINIKYLPKFKWFDLTQQISKENEQRQAKLSMELSQQLKVNNMFINNVEQSKMVQKMENKKKKRKHEQPEMRRSFKQRKVTSTRADADEALKQNKPNEKLNDILSKVF